MKLFYSFLRVVLFFVVCLHATVSWSQSNAILMFSYFKGNGEDGLHLAYSMDGMRWTALKHDSSFLKPMVGKEKLMRDPCIILGMDGYFHMVWTASWQDKGIGYAHSKDLITWSEQQFIPVMQHETAALNCWAPEITYDRKNKRYMIYWATTIPGRYPGTDTSGDGKYNHRLYYVTTRDFKQYSDTKLLYNKGFSVIDASIVSNGNRYLMFLKDETRKPPQKNLRFAIAENATGPYSDPSAPFTDTSYWAEGPTTIHSDGKWTVYFDKYTQHKMGAVQSSDLKQWTDISHQVRFPDGTRHGTVFTISQKQWNHLKQSIRF